MDPSPPPAALFPPPLSRSKNGTRASVHLKSTLEIRCEERGSPALFPPKLHPELNPIEQCWCYAKLMYREFLLSPKEAVMHSYVVDVLDSISLKHTRQ